jgi:hypothetical protein
MEAPQDFELPHELAARLVAIHEDLESYRFMAWRHGVDFTAGYIGRLEERYELYLEWAPRLRSFAAECRTAQPLPYADALTLCERAQQQIYEPKLDRPVLAMANTVAICRMPLIAMPIAMNRWGHDDDRIVLLTPEEATRWHEIYLHPEEAFSWLAHFWWDIDDEPAREYSHSGETFAKWEEDALKAGEQPWLVAVGKQFGPLAGGGYSDLWAWNGREARMIQNVEMWVS